MCSCEGFLKKDGVMWSHSSAAAALVLGQGGKKKRSDFTHELFPFLAKKSQEITCGSFMQQICWHLSDVLFWKPFGCFTHHTVHALATGVILMRSKEPIQHLSTIKQ